MPEVRPLALHRSVFARLVAIMLAMAGVLLLMVAGFFFMIVIPGIHDSLHRVVGPHVKAIADLEPDLERARRFAERLDMEIRFEGPRGGWTTHDGVPTVEQVMAMQNDIRHRVFVPRWTYYVVPVEAGTYVFARSVGKDFNRAHNLMVTLLLVSMAGVFAAAYLVMRGALRPLRSLTAGVEGLGRGELDVVVAKHSDDEFGQLTDAFNHMAGRVREMVRAREELLRDVSHELRSPLTRMKVALELMPSGAQKISMAEDVKEMEDMVTQLLEMQRLRGGHVGDVERFDLGGVVRDLVARYAGAGPGVGVAPTPASAPIDAAREDVRTVTRNLIENALKYSLPDSRPIEVRIDLEADAVVMRVTDDGQGLPDGDPERLFEAFHRPDPSRSRKTGGYGLGLNICRRIMEAHGGSLELARNTPRGTVASARFPMAPP